MGVDLTGGLAAEREYVFGEQPDDPEMRESVNVWVWDDGGEVGMPADRRRGGGRPVGDPRRPGELPSPTAGSSTSSSGAGARPARRRRQAALLGAGPLSFELIEPFRHWRMRLDGLAVGHVGRRSTAGPRPGRRPPVDIEVDIGSAVPPWENGALLAEAGTCSATRRRAHLMGGPRFEQLFRVTGTLRVGDESRELNGGGLRIRRQGIRRLASFWGHAWQSRVFPSGRAFGYLVYPRAPTASRPTTRATCSTATAARPGARRRGAVAAHAEPSGEDVPVCSRPSDGGPRRSRARR